MVADCWKNGDMNEKVHEKWGLPLSWVCDKYSNSWWHLIMLMIQSLIFVTNPSKRWPSFQPWIPQSIANLYNLLNFGQSRYSLISFIFYEKLFCAQRHCSSFFGYLKLRNHCFFDYVTEQWINLKLLLLSLTYISAISYHIKTRKHFLIADLLWGKAGPR